MEDTLKENRRKLLLKHFVQGKPRTDVRVTTVYATEEDRIQVEDINNATKSEILERAEEKINLVSDEDIKDVLQNKMNELKRKQSSLKKVVLLFFFYEVCEELNQVVDNEQEILFVEDQDNDTFNWACSGKVSVSNMVTVHFNNSNYTFSIKCKLGTKLIKAQCK